MPGNWSIKANAPGDNLFVAISVQHPKLGNYFTATLQAKRVSSSRVCKSWNILLVETVFTVCLYVFLSAYTVKPFIFLSFGYFLTLLS